MAKKSLTRRDFIKLAGVTLGASVIAACTPQVEVVTVTPGPTNTPEPAKLEVWWNTNLPDLTTADWKNDPNDPVFKAEWFWGGLGRLKYRPFLANHPGVSMNVTTHSWDTDLRTNQLLAIASGQSPDTTYGEAYVNEFVQYGVYAELSPDKAKLFPPGPTFGATTNGKCYGFPKSTGANVLFVNLDTLAKYNIDATKLPTTWDELVTFCQTVSAKNKSDKWGNTAYYTYGTTGTTYGAAMRILQWFNANNCPLADLNNNITANTAGAADTWFFHNKLMWSSTYNLIYQAESEGGSGQLFNEGVIVVKPGWNNDATSVGNGFQADGKTPVNAVGIAMPTAPSGKTSTTLVGNDMESAFKSSKWVDVAKAVVEETTTDEAAQAFLADNAGIWIPALKSQLDQYATYDKLGGYKSDVAKAIVRQTMKAADDPTTMPIPGFKKNAQDIWTEWNAMGVRIMGDKAPGMSKADIQKQLDAFQTFAAGRLA